MVNYYPVKLDATFSALSDPTRRAMLARLARGGASVGELARPFAMSLPAVSKHLRVLDGAGLITRERRGRVHRLSLAPRPLEEAQAWIERYRDFWQQQLDALADYLDTSLEKEKTSWRKKSKTPTHASRSGEPSRRGARRSLRRGPRRSK